ncbi:hypothetical protein H0H92_007541 [Tricholoma furcatifolium]|nr:hypothetical protein H0H92_007541 [Tricholoma furcatifolium]
MRVPFLHSGERRISGILSEEALLHSDLTDKLDSTRVMALQEGLKRNCVARRLDAERGGLNGGERIASKPHMRRHTCTNERTKRSMPARGGSTRVGEGARTNRAMALRPVRISAKFSIQGEMLDLKLIVNSMVAQLSTLANEMMRVSLLVGTEGILDGHASVPDVRGMWKASIFPSSIPRTTPYGKGAPRAMRLSTTSKPHHHGRTGGGIATAGTHVLCIVVEGQVRTHG